MSGRATYRPQLLEQDAASHKLHVVVHFAVCGSSIRSGLPCSCSHCGQVKIIKCRFGPINRTGEHAAAALLTDRTLAAAGHSYDSSQGATCRQGYEGLAQFWRWLQRLLGHSIPLRLGFRGCSRCICCWRCLWRRRRRSVGERLDNHNPDQSSRQLVRWEMTAGGVQPLVIDEKGTE